MGYRELRSYFLEKYGRRGFLEERAREKAEREAQSAFVDAAKARNDKAKGHLFDFENAIGHRMDVGSAYHYLLDEVGYLRARVDRLEKE